MTNTPQIESPATNWMDPLDYAATARTAQWELGLARQCLDRSNPVACNRAWATLEACYKASVLRSLAPFASDAGECENQWQRFVMLEIERPGGYRLASFVRGARRASRQSLGGFLATCLKHECLRHLRQAKRDRNALQQLHAQTALHHIDHLPADDAGAAAPTAVGEELLDVIDRFDQAFGTAHPQPAQAIRALTRARREHLTQALGSVRKREQKVAFLLFFERVDDLVYRAAQFAPAHAARTAAGTRARNACQRRLLRGFDPQWLDHPSSYCEWTPAERRQPLKPGWDVSLGAVWSVLWCHLSYNGFSKVTVGAIARAGSVAHSQCRDGALRPSGRIVDLPQLCAEVDRINGFRDGALSARADTPAQTTGRTLYSLMKYRERLQRAVCAGAAASKDPALCAGIRLLFSYWRKNKGQYFDRHLRMPA